jgi:DNA excision repair protein ERCC-5
VCVVCRVSSTNRFFRRICRLLYHRISPIFVFDGATPALKRRTTAKRRRIRENDTAKVRRTAEKLLLNAMKASVFNQALNKEKDAGRGGGGSGGGGSGGGGGGGDVVDLTDEDATTAAAVAAAARRAEAKGKRPKGHRDDDDDIEKEEEEQWERWEDFEDVGGEGGGGGRSRMEVDITQRDDHHVDRAELNDDPEWNEEDEEEEEEEEEEEDMMIPDADDIDPEVLASLPPSVQMEVMKKMKERRVMDNREQFQSLSGWGCTS